MRMSFSLAGLLLASSAYAVTLRVPQDYNHISLAMAVANPDDVIEIAASPTPRPEPQVLLKDRVTVRGETGNMADVELYCVDDVPLFIGDDETGAATLEGFTIEPISGGTNKRAVHITKCELVMSNMKLSGCTAVGSGGAVYAEHSLLELSNVHFTSNESTMGNGGGLYSTYTVLTMTDCVFSGNHAFGGGGLYYHESDEGEGVIPYFGIGLALENVDFIQNTAGDGAAAKMDCWGTANRTWTGGAINGNDADLEGGGLYLAGSTIPVLDDLDFESNEARSGGGLFLQPSGALENLRFTGNTSYEKGGAIMCGDISTDVAISGCLFSSNKVLGGTPTSAVYGSAIRCQSQGVLTLANCQFIGNVGGTLLSSVYGGVVSCESAEISNCLFADNEVATENYVQGAVCNFGSFATIYGSTFVGNTATVATDIDGLVLYGDNDITLATSNLQDNSTNLASIPPVDVYWSEVVIASHTNVNGNSGGNWVGDLAGQDAQNGNRSVNSAFVDPSNPVSPDYRLRWNSPLMDTGDSAAPLDFDLTARDIGWQQPYPVLTTLTTTGSVLPAGRYQINANTYLGAADLVVEHDVGHSCGSREEAAA